MKQIVIKVLGSRNLNMSKLLCSTGIIGEVYLNGSTTFKMPLQNLFCLDRRHGMKLVRNVDLFRMLRNIGMVDTAFEEVVRDKSFQAIMSSKS
jgi:hypothetical protein